MAPLWGLCVGVLCVLWPPEKLPVKFLFFQRRDSLIVTFPAKELVFRGLSPAIFTRDSSDDFGTFWCWLCLMSAGMWQTPE